VTPGAAERPDRLLEAARATRGFMPDDEGLALGKAARAVIESAELPSRILEVGAYCGKSALYLAAGVAAGEALGDGPPVVFSLDHHHGSEENQAGWPHHDKDLVDEATGRLETLCCWRQSIESAGAGDLVVGLIGESATVAAHWKSPLGLCFIDGGHGEEPAWADYRGWSPHVAPGGLLAIHDVFPDPADGGRPPYEIYCAALEEGLFVEQERLGRGSLRVLRRS
jgi:predicted O-methyltransferase YrrM